MPDAKAQPQTEVVMIPPDKAPPAQGEAEAPDGRDQIAQPAKVMRIGSMVRQLLEEVRHAGLDEPSRERLREIFETSVTELSEVLSPDLREEMKRLSLPFDEKVPSESELRVAHAQLVGWLEGLFHGIQAMLFAQQVESRARFEQMRRGLPAGEETQEGAQQGPGTYL